MSRPIRFAAGAGPAAELRRLVAAAQRAEAIGYSTFSMADHFGLPLAPLIALQAVSDATTTLRLTQTVLAHDFRHPAVLAKEIATLDVLSGGRVEVGIGAGWFKSEYEQTGIRFEPATVRIAKLEEYAIVLKGLFEDEPFTFSGEHFSITDLDGTPKPAQRPHPPLLIGGGGKRLLAVAARQADIIHVIPRPGPTGQPLDTNELTARSHRDKVEHIKKVADGRFPDIELGIQLLVAAITDEPDRVLERFAREHGVDPSEIRASPLVAVGSLDEVCDKLLATREEFGISYFMCPFDVRPDSCASSLGADHREIGRSIVEAGHAQR